VVFSWVDWIGDVDACGLREYSLGVLDEGFLLFAIMN
jgi:hypothetical protein